MCAKTGATCEKITGTGTVIERIYAAIAALRTRTSGTTGATADRAIGPTPGPTAEKFAATIETFTGKREIFDPTGETSIGIDVMFGMIDGISIGIVTKSGVLSGGGRARARPDFFGLKINAEDVEVAEGKTKTTKTQRHKGIRVNCQR
jgi:hypothetical protein